MKRLLIAFAMASCCLNLFAVEWQAKWIGAPWEGEEFDKEVVSPAPEFRKKFETGKKVTRATAYVTGLGFFELYVNGRKVSDDVLTPNETSYGHRPGLPSLGIPLSDASWRGFRVLYMTYDVTGCIRRGENELGAVLGNGFFSTGRLRWVEPYGTPRFICQLEIEYADGSRQLVVSDDSWEVRPGPIVLNDLYEGEIYDARLADAGEWKSAVLRKAPDGILMPQDGPADRVAEVLKPKSVKRLEDGSWEVDFGEYVSGWVRLGNFRIPEGESIELEFPIETKGNGVYKYVSDGSRVKSYAPRFCWWVFDKVIVHGWPGRLKPSDIKAEVVHSDVRESARFACSDTLVNRINDIWKRTQTDNMHLGVATDCPHREKGPYTGDGEAACVAAMHNFDVKAFYAKWLHDMSDCQDTQTGYVPNGAPWHPGCGGGVAWGSAMCIIPWEHYLHYGDRSVLEENYVQMCEYLRFMQRWRLEDGTMLQQMSVDGKPLYWLNLGEWCPPYNLPSENLVHTWFLWRCATYTANAAHALGLSEDESKYRALADDVAAAFHRKFYNPEAGTYGAGTGILDKSGYGTGNGGGAGDGSNIFALAMGVPQEYREEVISTVRKEWEANGGHLNTGIFGTGLYFETLCDCGLAEEAYVAMTRTDFPSFGYWVKQGATTTWEQWNGEASHNHPMFGGALVWLYRKICGVQTDPEEPGYKHVIIRPTPVGEMTWASYDTDTSFGKLSVRWHRKGGTFFLKVRVPKGSHATIHMPDGSSPVEIESGRRQFKCKI